MSGGIAVAIFKDIFNENQLHKCGLNDRQLKALLFWKDAGEILTNQYREKFEITDRTALRDLTELINMGFLLKTGHKKSSKYIYRGRMSDKNTKVKLVAGTIYKQIGSCLKQKQIRPTHIYQKWG